MRAAPSNNRARPEAMTVGIGMCIQSPLSAACWMAWIGLAVLFCLNPYAGYIVPASFITLALSVLLAFCSPREATYLLPIALLLGPIYAISGPGVGNVNLGDLYSLALLFSLLVISKRRVSLRITPLLMAFVFLLVGSTCFAADVPAAIAGLAKVMQFIVLVWVTQQHIKTDSERVNWFLGWIIAVTIGGMMMLWFWGVLKPSFLLDWSNAGGESESADFLRTDVLFRPSYFYTNFHLPLGMCIVVGVWLILSNVVTLNVATRLFLAFSIPVNLITLILNNTRAIMLPVAVALAVLLVTYAWRALNSARGRIRLIFVFLLTGLLTYASTNWINFPQMTALYERTTDEASMQARLDLWAGSLSKVVDHPVRLFITGFGPQATVRQSSDEMKDLLTGVTGASEGAFDSTLVGFLVEYGAITTMLVVAYFFWWMRKVLATSWRSGNPVWGLYANLGFVIFFSQFFQQFGFSPPALIALQLLTFVPPNAPWLRKAPSAPALQGC